MIGRVSTGQGLAAVLKAVSVWLLFVVGGCGGCIYLVSTTVFTADKLAKRAAASVKEGQELRQVLSIHSEFMKVVKQTRPGPMFFFGHSGKSPGGGNDDCGSLTIYESGRVAYKTGGPESPPDDRIFVKGQDWGAEFVEKHAARLKTCNVLSTNMMKNSPNHCPVFVEYDKNLRVVRAGTKPCWD